MISTSILDRSLIDSIEKGESSPTFNKMTPFSFNKSDLETKNHLSLGSGAVWVDNRYIKFTAYNSNISFRIDEADCNLNNCLVGNKYLQVDVKLVQDIISDLPFNFRKYNDILTMNIEVKYKSYTDENNNDVYPTSKFIQCSIRDTSESFIFDSGLTDDKLNIDCLLFGIKAGTPQIPGTFEPQLKDVKVYYYTPVSEQNINETIDERVNDDINNDPTTQQNIDNRIGNYLQNNPVQLLIPLRQSVPSPSDVPDGYIFRLQ